MNAASLLSLPARSSLFVALWLAGVLQVPAQSLKFPGVAELKFPVPSPVFVPPPPPREVPAMAVKGAVSRDFGTHAVSVLRGEASTLPDIPPPPPPGPPPAPGKPGPPQWMLSFPAVVYDGQLSRVSWNDPKARQFLEAWCAWDWTLLAPAAGLRASPELSIGTVSAFNVDTAVPGISGRLPVIPGHPVLLPGTFQVTKGNAEDALSLRALEFLREVTVTHWQQLELLRTARESGREQERAWKAANPPRPHNHTVWLKPHRGSRYLESATETGKEAVK